MTINSPQLPKLYNFPDMGIIGQNQFNNLGKIVRADTVISG